MIHYKIPERVPQKSGNQKENKMKTITNIVGITVIGIVVIVVLGLILSLPVMWLWNACLVAAIPGIKEIGWLQAWGILVLCGMLFKSSSS